MAALPGTARPGTASAAVPPDWQRVRAFQGVLDAAARVLDGRPVDAVERLDPGRYRVRAGPCTVTVRVVPRPRAEPGPQNFDALPDRPDCP
ncbi:hypothetical protein Q8W71_09620 [Methylobacterium sp. NEAU 140]|uniref:hypothetical protein n=1 Tax=Methylobacterium sp. NEAU 140 TaxID=3064945 RepID=UPI002733A985|nr:hypothetical protein [Methylobacterium sp. NEAU 140]MDP4022879.1 hypothetical protein [Methylobacterium sp. NEAU 140]